MAKVRPQTLRAVLGEYPTGVAVVTVRTSSEIHGATVSSFLGVSLDPPIVLVSLRHESRLAHLVSDARFFVSVLAHDQAHLARHFAGQRQQPTIDWRDREAPLLRHAAAHMECRTWRTLDVGDHMLAFGLVLAADSNDRKPLVYHRGDLQAELRNAREVDTPHG